MCVIIIINNMLGGFDNTEVTDISYDTFLDNVYAENIATVEYSEADGYIYFTLH